MEFEAYQDILAPNIFRVCTKGLHPRVCRLLYYLRMGAEATSMAIRPSKSFALARSGCSATKSLTLDCSASNPSMVSSCFAGVYKARGVYKGGERVYKGGIM